MKAKVKVVAHKNHLVFIPVEPGLGIGKSWVPTGDGNMGPVIIGDTKDTVMMSREALELVKKIKNNRDAVGDLSWDRGSFAWWGPLYRVMNPHKAEAARDSGIWEFTPIDNNELTPFEKRAVARAIKAGDAAWKWPESIHRKKPNKLDLPHTAFDGMQTNYHDGMVYLASPYSHKDKDVVAVRTALAANVAARLVKLEVHVVSPIVYGTALMATGHMKADDSWSSWQGFCHAVLDNSKAMYVIKTDGWQESAGIQGEIIRATRKGIACFLIDPETLELEPIQQKLPLDEISKADVVRIADLYGLKYSHHDVNKDRYLRGDEKKDKSTHQVVIYGNPDGPASLALTRAGKVVNPFFGDMFGDSMMEHLKKTIEGMGKDDPRRKDFVKMFEEKSAENAKAAAVASELNKILENYLV